MIFYLSGGCATNEDTDYVVFLIYCTSW